METDGAVGILQRLGGDFVRKEKRLVIWRPNTPRKCFYDWNGSVLIVVEAILCLPFFILARNDAVTHAWVYDFCIVAAIGAVFIGINARRLPTFAKGVPVLLYAVYYICQACGIFVSLQEINACMIPALIISVLRLIAGIAMIVLVLGLCCRTNPMLPCLYWSMIRKACMFSVVSDLILFGITFLTLDIGVLIGTGLYELTIRLFGEFWFSMAALIALQPKYITINYRKFNRLLWDYLTITPCVALGMVVVSLIFAGEVSVRFIVWSAAMFSMETFPFKWIYRRSKLDIKRSQRRCKNYIREFCAKRWFYSYYDIEDILTIERRLEDIKQEQIFLNSFPFTDDIVERLNSLDKEEFDLYTRLEWRYSIDVEFPMGPC